MCPRFLPLIFRPQRAALPPPARLRARLLPSAGLGQKNERSPLALHSAGKGPAWAGGWSGKAGERGSGPGLDTGRCPPSKPLPSWPRVQSKDSGTWGLSAQPHVPKTLKEHRPLSPSLPPRSGCQMELYPEARTARTPSLGLNLGNRKAVSCPSLLLEEVCLFFFFSFNGVPRAVF